MPSWLALRIRPRHRTVWPGPGCGPCWFEGSRARCARPRGSSGPAARNRRELAETVAIVATCQDLPVPDNGAPARTRTWNLRLRRPLLSPVELQAQVMLQKALTVLGPQAHFLARQPRRLFLWRTPVVKECAIPVKGSHCNVSHCNALCIGPNPLYKKEGIRRLLIPLRQRTFLQEFSFYAAWYNEHRPHTALRGATPNERYFGLRPANRAPRFEPRPHWPRGSPCAKPQTLIMGQPGARIKLAITFEAGRRHLPVVTLRRVA